MKQENRNLLNWELQQLEEVVSTGQYKKLNLSKLENFVLNVLPKNPDMAGELLPKLDKFSIEFMRGFQKTSVAEQSTRDDLLCAAALINAVLGNDRKVADTTRDVQQNRIDGINNKFVLDKLYKYMEKGGALVKRNKIWSKLINAYKRGEISALKGKSKTVTKMIKREKEKGLFDKFKDLLGL